MASGCNFYIEEGNVNMKYLDITHKFQKIRSFLSLPCSVAKFASQTR